MFKRENVQFCVGAAAGITGKQNYKNYQSEINIYHSVNICLQ